MSKSATDAGKHATARRRRRVISLVLLSGISLPPLLWAASGNTFKWQDSDGNITYGDTPPRGVAAELVSVRVGSSRMASDLATEPVTQAINSEQTASTQVAAANEMSPERAAALCQQAKANLTILNSNALIRQTDESGKELILDEQAKQAQIQTAKDIIGYHCS